MKVDTPSASPSNDADALGREAASLAGDERVGPQHIALRLVLQGIQAAPRRHLYHAPPLCHPQSRVATETHGAAYAFLVQGRVVHAATPSQRPFPRRSLKAHASKDGGR